VFLWLLITFPRWQFFPHARRESQQRPQPISSLNECGYSLGSQKPLSHIGIVGSSAHYGRASSHFLTPISPSPLSFHPQKDGQTEVINQMIMHILCMHNSKHPHTWDESLPYVQKNHNKSIHNSTDHNPFQVGLGFQPLGPMDVTLPFAATQKDL
jgi:hypothetical protein